MFSSCIILYQYSLPLHAVLQELHTHLYHIILTFSNSLMSCLSLSLPDAQFSSFSILFLLCAFKHSSLMLERAHDIVAFCVSCITDVQFSESKPLSPVSSLLFSLNSQVLIFIHVLQCGILKVRCISVCTFSPP